MAVVQIEYPEAFVNGQPKSGGLMDPRMGTITKSGAKSACETCKGGINSCPGHFGRIELAQPVFHQGLMPYVYRVLQSVCFYCSKLLVDPTTDGWAQATSLRNPRSRLISVHALCKKKHVCEQFSPDLPGQDEGTHPVTSHGGCGNMQPKFSRNGPLGFFVEFPRDDSAAAAAAQGNEKKRELSAREAHEVLRRISDEDCRTLGFDVRQSKPDWMILTVLPVPPPQVRPTVIMDSVSRGEDDLTHKLAGILKESAEIQKNKDAPPHVIQDHVKLLQYHVATYFDNEIPDMPQSTTRKGRPLKSIRQRLKGKEGRIRGNLMGKRVDFSARTVITPDPNLSIDEVGVPRSMALNLTVPETVTPLNIDRLRELVRNGPLMYPGANYVVRSDGTRVDLRWPRSNAGAGTVHLECGYKVERHLHDGDYVVFNRQPSLHKMSMMGHRARIMPYSSFRVNLCVTTPYNADFDGDEMNLHVPQSLASRAEVSSLMMVPRQIVTSAANRPVMGIVQDSLLGSKLFSLRSTFLDRESLFSLIMWLTNWNGRIPHPAILKPQPLWTGKQVFSMFIPDINLSRSISDGPTPNEDECGLYPDDMHVEIIGGQLMAGQLTSKIIGPKSAGGIQHVAWKEHGPESAKGFLNQVQRIVNCWLLQHGFSVGIADTIADRQTNEQINQTISKAKADVRDLIDRHRHGQLDPIPGITINAAFEKRVNNVLNSARSDSGSAALNFLRSTNNFKLMVEAGSKGNTLNISQITACVGQQNVEGARVPFGFINRTLPHFLQHDEGPESRGFVQNSYLRGLTPQEFFFHAMGGREGLIDTAVKTGETGYIQRKLMKAMEDVQCRYDGTVRNSSGTIVQFLYGEDGLDGSSVEGQRLETLKASDEAMRQTYELLEQNSNRIGAWAELAMSPASLDDLKADASFPVLAREEYDRLLEDRALLRRDFPGGNVLEAPFLPGNLKRIIVNAQRTFHVDVRRPTSLAPRYVIEGVRGVLSRLEAVVLPIEDEEQRKSALQLFSIFVRSTLAAKKVIGEYRLSQDAFDWLLCQLETQFNKSLCQPGESVGPLAAQSIGEPATQMTLNTFHFAGVSEKNVTLGVPRLKELINVAKKMRTPWLTVYLLPEYSGDRETAKTVQSNLEYTTLGRVTASSEIYYDPNIRDGGAVEEDREFVRTYYAMPDEEVKEDRISPWLLRLVLDKAMMFDKKLTMEKIGDRIKEAFADSLHVVYSDDNADKLVVRVRFQYDDEQLKNRSREMSPQEQAEADNDELRSLMQVEARMLSELPLCGVKGIEKVSMKAEGKFVIDPRGCIVEKNKSDKEWILDTGGSNLREVMAHPYVDPSRVVSNSIVEVLDVLGIEAARATLFRELRTVISFDGAYVNYRHLAILADIMTLRGSLMPISRHGVNRTEAGALMRASFEESMEQLLQAAAFAEVDELRGVSQNVMLGAMCPLGTGAVDVLLDAEMLEHAVTMPVMAGAGKLGLWSPGRSPVPNTPFASSPTGSGSSYTPGPYGNDATWSPAPGGSSPYGSSGMGAQYSPTASPAYSPSSPAYSPSSPAYSPTSPAYSPTSPAYSPSSPAYSPSSPAYSPSSPAYSPSTSRKGASPATDASPSYSPSSPKYSPSSPAYSPSSPQYSPSSPKYSPSSPQYSPSSPKYSPSSPGYSPSSPKYSPSSPKYSPSSPKYSPSSPKYSPSSPSYTPSSPTFSPAEPSAVAKPGSVYSPESPTEGEGDLESLAGRTTRALAAAKTKAERDSVKEHLQKVLTKATEAIPKAQDATSGEGAAALAEISEMVERGEWQAAQVKVLASRAQLLALLGEEALASLQEALSQSQQK